MRWEVVRHFVREEASPQLAREFCSQSLRPILPSDEATQALINDAELVASELMTNALNARCSSMELRLARHDNCLTLSLFDDATGTPVPRNVSSDDDHGRGLTIVAALAACWGVEISRVGKRVWADLTVPAPLATSAERNALV